VIAVFSFLPTLAQARRQHRLRRLSITQAERKPGVFRLAPYGAAEAEEYARPDGADVAALAWLRGSTRTLLYLSGPSGAGKSSLIGAAVLPRLRDEGWETLVVRVYAADPEAALRDALLSRKDLYRSLPSRNTSLRTMLDRAAAERKRAGSAALLVVIDQFEEVLILDDDAARAPVVELLRSLDRDPVPGLRLLCVFRSDYREWLFKHVLPASVAGANTFELPHFLRAEAEAFLRRGGQRAPTAQHRGRRPHAVAGS
jgi:hypothetical protein